MDTFTRAHLAMIIQIMHFIIILLTKERMDPEGEAEVEEGEMEIEMRITVVPVPGGRDKEKIMDLTEVQGVVAQEDILWMDLMDPAGAERTKVNIWNKLMEIRLKDPGSLARSQGEDSRMVKGLT